MIHALAALAGYAFILRRLESDVQVTPWLLSLLFSFSLAALSGLILSDTFSASAAGQAASDAYKAFDYLPMLGLGLARFLSTRINGVGIRGWGSMVVSMKVSMCCLCPSDGTTSMRSRWRSILVSPGSWVALFFLFLGQRLSIRAPRLR